MSIISVAIVIAATPSAGLSPQVLSLYFDLFPTHSDLKLAVAEEDKDGRFVELFEALEVGDIEAYKEDFLEDKIIQFDAQDSDQNVIGHVLLVERALNESTALTLV